MGCAYLFSISADICPDPSENKPVHVTCISKYREKYLNKNITVQGVYSIHYSEGVVRKYIVGRSIEHSDFRLYFVTVEGVSDSALEPYEEYYFTGILRAMSLDDPDRFDEYSNLYLEVTAVNPV